MLALKSLISSQNSIPTIIFDEIDMGVSGQVAGKVGDILKDMGRGRQLIAITHLPQIAAKGRDHLFVVKESLANDTRSTILRLKKEERVEQIARMMSDDSLSNAAIKAANELLSKN
jgi:DNA repair protein RecN (Recombination protein N)